MKLTQVFVDQINSRFHKLSGARNYRSSSPVWSVEFFESIVAFHVDRRKSSMDSREAFNRQEDEQENLPLDFRHYRKNLFGMNPNLFVSSRVIRFIVSSWGAWAIRDYRRLRRLFKSFDK
jgi:hypothetical protein